MRFLILMFSMLSIAMPLNAAGNVRTYNVFKKSNPIFDKHKKSFERYYTFYTGNTVDTSNILINLVKEPSNYCTKNGNCSSKLSGLCYRRASGEREIFISRRLYNSYDKYSREELIFHELAHCSLDMGHRNTKYNNDQISLMGPKMFSQPNFYKKHKEALLEEMFTNNIDNIIQGILDESY